MFDAVECRLQQIVEQGRDAGPSRAKRRPVLLDSLHKLLHNIPPFDTTCNARRYQWKSYPTSHSLQVLPMRSVAESVLTSPKVRLAQFNRQHPSDLAFALPCEIIEQPHLTPNTNKTCTHLLPLVPGVGSEPSASVPAFSAA